MKSKGFFLLSWKKLWLLVSIGFVSIVLHNLISGLIKTEEVFFFTIVIFILPAYMLIAIPLSLFSSLKKTAKK